MYFVRQPVLSKAGILVIGTVFCLVTIVVLSISNNRPIISLAIFVHTGILTM
jgi:hypothetical protein